MTFAARPLMAYSPTYTGTMTQSQVTDGSTFNFLGFGGAGSMSPTTLSDGNTITFWYDETIGSYCQFSIAVASDPGQSYIGQVTAHGTTKTTASASSYTYSGGNATWKWNGASFGFTSSGTTSASVP